MCFTIIKRSRTAPVNLSINKSRNIITFEVIKSKNLSLNFTHSQQNLKEEWSKAQLSLRKAGKGTERNVKSKHAICFNLSKSFRSKRLLRKVLIKVFLWTFIVNIASTAKLKSNTSTINITFNGDEMNQSATFAPLREKMFKTLTNISIQNAPLYPESTKNNPLRHSWQLTEDNLIQMKSEKYPQAVSVIQKVSNDLIN